MNERSVRGRDPTPSARRIRLRGVALSLVSLVVMFIGLEIAIRLFYVFNGEFETIRQARELGAYQKSPDPELIFEYKPNFVRDGVLMTDSNGVRRSEQVPFEKPENEIRIVLIGDSIAASGEFAERIEANLNRPPVVPETRVKVLNFAHDGYRTTQQVRMLELKGVRYDPDLILVQYCLNDVGNNHTPAKYFLDPPASYLLDFIARRTGIGRDPRMSDTVPIFGPGYNTFDYWARLYARDSASWASVTEGFARVAELGRERRIPAALAIFPLLLDAGWRTPATERLHRQIREAGEAAGLEVMDLLNVLDEHPVEVLQLNRGDIYHANEDGLHLAADHVAPVLRKALETNAGVRRN